MTGKDDRRTHQLVKIMQKRAYDAITHDDFCKDHALISFALVELGVIIAVATRAREFTRLDHRDRVVEAIRQIHNHVWDDVGMHKLFESIQKDIEDCDE